MGTASAPLVVRCGAMGDMVLVLSLTEALQRRLGTKDDVISSGGRTRPEAALNERIVQLAGSARVHNAATALPKARLLAVQERAVGMVSVDTGPAHSRAALDCPLVVLFGGVDPVRYAPRSPSGRVEIIVRPRERCARGGLDHGRCGACRVAASGAPGLQRKGSCVGLSEQRA